MLEILDPCMYNLLLHKALIFEKIRLDYTTMEIVI